MTNDTNQEHEEVLNFAHSLPSGLTKEQIYVRIHERAKSTASADQAAGVVPAELTDDAIFNYWLHRDCMDAIRAGDMQAQFVSAVRALLRAASPAVQQPAEQAAPVAESQPTMPTAQQIHAAARKMCDLSAEACGVDKDDNWAIYGDAYNEEAKAVLTAALSAPAAPVPATSDKAEGKKMALRWKKNPRETGLRAVVAGPRGSTLQKGGEKFATVNAHRNWGAGPQYKGWYWVARNDARGVPLMSTCNEPCADEPTAKAAAMAYVKKCLATETKE